MNNIKHFAFIMDIGSVLLEVETEVLCIIWRMSLEGSPWMSGVNEWVVNAPEYLVSTSVRIICSSIPVWYNLLEIWLSASTS